MFKEFTIRTLTGFISSPTSGVKTEDTSMIVTIAANATATERTKSISIDFTDFDNNDLKVEIAITQNA